MDSGVPDTCPFPVFDFCPPGRPRLIGFVFPEVPGIPPIRDSLARRFHAAAASGDGLNGCMPSEEWTATLATIAGEFDRADYHRDRFHAVVEILKARRKVAGGPVFGDPAPARAAYCEAVGYLGAVRTAVDVVVYAAARRAGADVSAAEKWKASAAIAPVTGTGDPPSKYDTDDIRALRRHRHWFETLNLYRNCMLHRGWHDQSFGYFNRADSAPEANDPIYNVMLVPDLAPLKHGARPDKWTYQDRAWLDELVQEIHAGTELAVDDLLRVWAVPVPAPGKIPLEDQATTFLTVPLLRPIQGQSPPTLHVFLSKHAARLFLEHFQEHHVPLANCSYRAVRQMSLDGRALGYLFAYDASSLGESAELQILDVHLGKVRILETHRVSTTDQNGPLKGTLWIKLPSFPGDVVYVLDCASCESHPR